METFYVDLRISVSMTVTLACFVLELVLNSLAKPHYICRFAFWLDLAASFPGILRIRFSRVQSPRKCCTCHYFCRPTKKVSFLGEVSSIRIVDLGTGKSSLNVNVFLMGEIWKISRQPSCLENREGIHTPHLLFQPKR